MSSKKRSRPASAGHAQHHISAEVLELTDVVTTAALLSISRRKLYDLIAAGEIESVKLGGRRLIPRRARERLIERLLSKERTHGGQ